MSEIKNHCPEPVYTKLLGLAKEDGSVHEYSLSMQELQELFKRQAEIDDSGDEPELLLNSVFEITAEGLHIFTPYLISNSDCPLNKIGLVIEGTVNNDGVGVLSDQEEAVVYTDSDTNLRVMESFGTEERLSMKSYLKSMLEAALNDEIFIAEMYLKENNLVLEFEENNKVKR